jgi:hypothetical protein
MCLVLGAAHRWLTIIPNKLHEQHSGRHYATLTHRCQRPSLANEKVALDAAICTVGVVSDIRRGVREEAS